MFYEKEKEKCPAYISKQTTNRETQIIPRMILNRERSHYFAVRKLSPLLRVNNFKP